MTNKQVIQTTTGQQVSAPVAQVVAGVAKVFVGEIIEKGARTSATVRFYCILTQRVTQRGRYRKDKARVVL